MNIGFDIRPIIGKPIFGSGAPAGVTGYASDLLRELVAQGECHEFFCFSNSLKKPDISLIRDVLRKKNVHLITTRVPNKLFDPIALATNTPKIDKIIEKATHSYAIKSSRNSSRNVKNMKLDFYVSPHFNIAPISRDTKHILVIHDLSFEIYPEFYGIRKQYWHKTQGIRESCKRAHVIVAVSNNTKNDIITMYGIDENKIKVIYPGIREFGKTSIKKPIEDKTEKPPHEYFLYLGTLEPRKNIEGIIEAYSRFRNKNKEKNTCKLLIAGGKGWKYKNIYKTTSKSKYSDDIVFEGYVNEKQKSYLIRNAVALIYPSFYEGFGLPPMEAHANNTPVITSHTSSIPEIMQHNAIYVNPYNVSDIAFAMETVLGDYKPAITNKHNLTTTSPRPWSKVAREFIGMMSGL